MTVKTILEKEKLLAGAWDDKLPQSFRAPFPLPEKQATSSGLPGRTPVHLPPDGAR